MKKIFLKKCLICSIQFKVFPSKQYLKYCSSKCYGISKKGKSRIGNSSNWKHSDITKEKLRKASLNNKSALGHKHTIATKRKISKALKNKPNSSSTKFYQGMTPWNKGQTGVIKHTLKAKKKISKASIRHWKNPNYARKVKHSISPNKDEIFLLSLLEKLFPQLYKFVGNHKFRIGRKFPDFVNQSENKVIELYGDYYHKNQNPQDRIEYFKPFGYDTLVIWSSELYDNIENTINRLYEFHNQHVKNT